MTSNTGSTMCEHLMTYEPSKDSDQPAQSEVRVIAGRSVDSKGSKAS